MSVVEVDRPNRQERRRAGKSDPIDAVEAARAALSGRAKGPIGMDEMAQEDVDVDDRGSDDGDMQVLTL